MFSVRKSLAGLCSRFVALFEAILASFSALAVIAQSWSSGRERAPRLHSPGGEASFTASASTGRSIAPTRHPAHLFGIDSWLDDQLWDLGFFAALNQEFHAGSQGDVSFLVKHEVGELLIAQFANTATAYFSAQEWNEIVHLRRDGCSGYHGESVDDPRLDQLLLALKGRVFIVTATDVSIPAIKDHNAAGFGGRGITALAVSPSGEGIRILYGNAEFGTLPSSETLVHVAALATMAKEGHETAAMVHCHPFPIVSLALHAKLRQGQRCDQDKLNAVLLTRIQSVLFYGKEQTPTIVPVAYADPGTAALVTATLDPLSISRFVVWENHGTVVMAPSIVAGYHMTASVSRAAEACRYSLEKDHGGLPMMADLHLALQRKELVGAFEELFGNIDRAPPASPHHLMPMDSHRR